MPRNSPFIIQLSDIEKAQLEGRVRKYTSSYNYVIRARIVLCAARGQANDQIAASLSIPRQIVSKWRKRFFDERLDGLDDKPRTGRPPSFSPRSGRAG